MVQDRCLFNIVRQYVAIAILLWGYGFLIRNDRKWYHLVMFGLIVVIAFLCHTSAIAGVLWILATFIPVPRQRWGNFFLYGILYVMAGRGILFGLNLFYNEYGEAESYGNTGSNILGILVPLGIVMFVWLYQNSLKKYKILVNSAVISAIFSIYSVIGMLIVSRIGNYLSIFNILLIPKLIDVMFRRFDYKSRTRLAILMILIYYLVMIWLNNSDLTEQDKKVIMRRFANGYMYNLKMISCLEKKEYEIVTGMMMREKKMMKYIGGFPCKYIYILTKIIGCRNTSNLLNLIKGER